MLQTGSRAPTPSGSAIAEADEASLEDPLIAIAGPIAGTQILILGAGKPDLMCDAIRLGCLTATCLRNTERPEAASCDVVLAPSVTPMCGLDGLVRQARRALVPTGRLVARITDPAGRVAVALAHLLRLNGFRVARPTSAGGHVLLVAELAAFGSHRHPFEERSR